MKKFVTAIVVVLLTMSLVVAQAEMRCKTVGVKYPMSDDESYFGIYVTDAGSEVEVQLTEDEYYDELSKVFERREAERKASEPAWYVKALDIIVFWD